MDDRGIAVRPFYHKDRDEYGILWPLCAFNLKLKNFRFGTSFWNETYHSFGTHRKFGLLPLFTYETDRKNYKFLWGFPLSWYKNKDNFAILPLFWKNNDFLWIGNFFKSERELLILPFYGQGPDWFYLLNFIYNSEKYSESYTFLPLAYYRTGENIKELLTPLFSFRRAEGNLSMLNIATLLYHYSGGKHYFFYPLADVDWEQNYRE